MNPSTSMRPVTVFLSAVSAEFHKPGEGGRRGFASYREVLARSLRQLGAGCSVVVEEDFAAGTGDMLGTLDADIARCDVVVHLVGRLAGSCPFPAEIRRLRERHPTLLAHEPELADELEDAAAVSYTQWEIYLAYEYRRDSLVFVAEPHAPRSPACTAVEMEASQAAHLARLVTTGKHRTPFADQNDLARQVVISLFRFCLGLWDADSTPDPAAVAAAREDAAGLVEEIAEGIRKPDPAAVHPGDPAGVDVFLRSLDTAALRRELDRRTALEVAAEYREELREEVDAEPTADGLRELALAELAMGNYPAAIDAARRCAQFGEAGMASEPDLFETHRQAALNGYLLLHDAAAAAGRRDEAAEAMERGGAHIDREREPVFWADFHEPLAEYHLDHAHWDRAEELIDEIVDVREEHQEGQAALAKSLLVWGRLLDSKANYEGVMSVAARAERLLGRQTRAEPALMAVAFNEQGSALRSLGRFAEAEPLLRRAIAVEEASLGPEHPSLAVSLVHLAELLRGTGRPGEAEPLLRRAIAVEEASLGPEHPSLASSLDALAGVLQDMGRPGEAEPLYRRAIVVKEASLGSEHPSLAVSLNNLARLAQDTGRLDEAEPLLRRTAAIMEASLGPEHPSLAISLNNLAALLADTDRLVEATPLLRRAIAIMEASLGPDHRSLASSLNNLALLLAATDRPEEAEAALRRALAILLHYRASAGQEHPGFRVVFGHYLSFLQRDGLDEAAVRERLNEIGRPYGISFGGPG